MKTVGIFRMNFPEVSETFIRAQMSTYRRYQPRVYAKRRLAASAWPVSAVSDHGIWAERNFLTTRSSRWHGRADGPAPQVLHAHFGVDGVYALPLARKLGIPLVTTFHGFDVLTKPGWWLRHPSIPVAVYRLHLRTLMASGARFIAVSRFVERALIATGFPAERIVQHYIGVDTARFQPGVGDTTLGRYVLSVGRHIAVKGLDVLLRAFARIAATHADVRLLQVGAGPLTKDLNELADALGLRERVVFLGAQPHERVLELMRGAEVFALPSLTQPSGQAEALGIVFNEAAACGIPVVSTFSGGIPEVVIHGETGLLCPEADHLALADNLDLLLGDAAVRQSFGQRGRQLVCNDFNLLKQTEKLERIYDEVVA